MQESRSLNQGAAFTVKSTAYANWLLCIVFSNQETEQFRDLYR
jgi:hypothetical protein